jgi:hypothetical protein
MSRRALTTPQDDYRRAGVARMASDSASARSRKPQGHKCEGNTPSVSRKTTFGPIARHIHIECLGTGKFTR